MIFFEIVCGHLHLFDILVQYKAPVHTADIHGAFPIHYASQLCKSSVNEDTMIDSEKGRIKFQKKIFCSFFYKLGLAVLQKLISYKVNIDCTDGQQRTPLMWSASAGYRTIFLF